MQDPYIVKSVNDNWNFYYTLIRTKDDEVIFSDRMEPEDAILPRDLRVLVEELNRVAKENQELIQCLMRLKDIVWAYRGDRLPLKDSLINNDLSTAMDLLKKLGAIK